MTEFVNGYVTKEQVATHQLMDSLLDSLYNEFSELSKKKPQDPLSAGKVKVVNRVLTPILSMLNDEPMRQFLDLLDDEELPQNSDVILMLGQVRAAMLTFKKRHWDGRRGWHVNDDDD